MHAKVAAATLALSLPAFLWPPKPARAATAEFAPSDLDCLRDVRIERGGDP